MISEKCAVATMLLIPRIPYDPHFDVQEVLRTNLVEALINHHKTVIIDQYDGGTATGEQCQRVWDADPPSYYGHRPTTLQPPMFTEVARLDIRTAFCSRAASLSRAYESELLEAVGQGSYLYQNDTGLPSDTGFDDSTRPLRELSVYDAKPSRTMGVNASEQRAMMHDSHASLVHYQARFDVASYQLTSDEHKEVYNMLQDTAHFYTMSFDNTGEGLLHAASTRIFELHLTRDESATTNPHSLSNTYGDTTVAKHLARQAVRYF